LTLADRRSHEILSTWLEKESPFPVLSEEGKHIPYEERKHWEYYWLIDPLDGTKEFISRNGEFTVNIALIHQDRPLLGVIYLPVSGVVYYAQEGEGAFKLESGTTTRLCVSRRREGLVVVGSRSHGTPQLSEYVDRVRDRYGEVRFASRGSSLKFCLVAEGAADIYPRLGPTMEWDTAAGQIIVEEAGGRVVESESGCRMRYNKQELINPFFVASQQL
jgi:3'(2'), 5'-bisphosphate nucleotidase